MKIRSRPGPREVEKALRAAMDYARSSDWSRMIRLLRDLVAYEPDNFDAVHLLAQAYVQAGQLEQGIKGLAHATKLRPQASGPWMSLGLAHQKAGQFAEALAAFDESARLRPADLDPVRLACRLLSDLDRADEAVSRATAFTVAHAASADGWVNRALAETAAGAQEAAVSSFERALAIDANNRMALRNLAILQMSLRRFERALPLAERALTLQGDDPDLAYAVIEARRSLCDWTGLEARQAALLDALRNSPASIHPIGLLDVTDDPSLQRLNATRQAARISPPPGVKRPSAQARDRLRIAYLSADFRDHPVCHLLGDLIAAHDRVANDVIGIAYGILQDSPERRAIADRFTTFVDLGPAAPVAIADRIRNLGIDVLVDLTGPTEGGRPEILALQPAPVQVAYLGFAGTSGAPYVDYLIADAVVVPPGAEQGFTEKIARLPGCYMPMPRWARGAARPRRDWGLPDRGVVLSAINATRKVSPEIFACWMRILKAVPESVLWIRVPNDEALARLRHEAEARGIAGDRILPAPFVNSREEHLARYAAADLFLDTTPYNAHTTAVEALTAGLPIVTCAGRSLASRVAASLLTATGLSDLVATSLSDYEVKAIALASNPAELAASRDRLASALQPGSTCDVRALAHHLEAAYRQMHALALKGEPPRAIDIPVS